MLTCMRFLIRCEPRPISLAVGLRFLNAVPHRFGTLQDLLAPCLTVRDAVPPVGAAFDQRSTLMLGGRAFFWLSLSFAA